MPPKDHHRSIKVGYNSFVCGIFLAIFTQPAQFLKTGDFSAESTFNIRLVLLMTFE